MKNLTKNEVSVVKLASEIIFDSSEKSQAIVLNTISKIQKLDARFENINLDLCAKELSRRFKI